MQNIVIDMCEKFHYDRLRNDKALGNWKSDNKNNIGSAWGPVTGSKNKITAERGVGEWWRLRWKTRLTTGDLTSKDSVKTTSDVTICRGWMCNVELHLFNEVHALSWILIIPIGLQFLHAWCNCISQFPFRRLRRCLNHRAGLPVCRACNGGRVWWSLVTCQWSVVTNSQTHSLHFRLSGYWLIEEVKVSISL